MRGGVLRGGRYGLVAAGLVVTVVWMLVWAADARAHHRPDYVGVSPDPAFLVPNPTGATALGSGASAQLALPPALPPEPDLIPIMPTKSAITIPGIPAIFMDAYQIPGRLLYRFDAVIGNVGGALDLFCEDCTKTSKVVYQAIWPTGKPPGVQNGSFAPIGTSNINLSQRGASMIYSPAVGHVHWHYDLAALYELLVPGGAALPTAKIGFCMFDTYDTASSTSYYSSGPSTWCQPGQPTADFVRMGISPGIGDYYNAQLTDQWIDVTGLPAGGYQLRATVNPGSIVDEASYDNNTQVFDRVLPGAVADDQTLATAPGAPLTITLTGSVAGPELPARQAFCASLYTANCYLDGFGNTPFSQNDENPTLAELTFTAVDGPAHGTISPFTPTGATTATTVYTPSPGYTGPDSFTITTTDERGLTSTQATIGIAVGPPVNTAAPAISGSTEVGQTLQTDTGAWSGVGPIGHDYQWQRCEGGACSPIGGASMSSYTLADGDVGRTVRVLVTASGPGGSATAASAEVGPVAARALELEKVSPKAKAVRRLTVRGTRGRDRLVGTRAAERLVGLRGNDRISGRGGADIAVGGRGADTIRGNSGNDTIRGGRGADHLFGGVGEDRIFGGKGNDIIDVDDGNADLVVCGPGRRDVVLSDPLDTIHASCEILA